MKGVCRILAAAALALVIAQPGFALGDAEHKTMLAQSQEYREADEGLNGAWKEAKKMLPADEYKKLLADQGRWVKTGRDAEAKAQIDAGTSKVDAYANVTMDRIRYVNNVISRSVLVHSDKGRQGLYTSTGKGMTGVLEVWWYDESDPVHYIIFENSVPSGKDGANLCSFQGKGPLEGNKLVAVSDQDNAVKVTIVFDGKKATVTTDEAFKSGGVCGQGVILDGVYSR